MKKIFNTFVVSALIGSIIFLVFFNEPEVVNTISYEYTTDTIFLDTLYVPGDPYPVSTPPKTVIEFVTDSNLISALRIQLRDQDILITSLEDSLLISSLYLKQFVSNPKFLSMNLSKDSLEIGMLRINGKVSDNRWPIDLLAFNYKWDNEVGLSRANVTRPPPVVEKQPFAQLYAGGGTDILNSSPFLSFTAQKSWTRIMISLNTDLGLLHNETNSIKLGLNYSLNGKKD